MNSDWRNEIDEDGFPVPNEDRVGDIFLHAEGGHWYCLFIEGLGYCWTQL